MQIRQYRPASVAYPRLERATKQSLGGLNINEELLFEDLIAHFEVALGIRVRSIANKYNEIVEW